MVTGTTPGIMSGSTYWSPDRKRRAVGASVSGGAASAAQIMEGELAGAPEPEIQPEVQPEPQPEQRHEEEYPAAAKKAATLVERDKLFKKLGYTKLPRDNIKYKYLERWEVEAFATLRGHQVKRLQRKLDDADALNQRLREKLRRAALTAAGLAAAARRQEQARRRDGSAEISAARALLRAAPNPVGPAQAKSRAKGRGDVLLNLARCINRGRLPLDCLMLLYIADVARNLLYAFSTSFLWSQRVLLMFAVAYVSGGAKSCLRVLTGHVRPSNVQGQPTEVEALVADRSYNLLGPSASTMRRVARAQAQKLGGGDQGDAAGPLSNTSQYRDRVGMQYGAIDALLRIAAAAEAGPGGSGGGGGGGEPQAAAASPTGAAAAAEAGPGGSGGGGGGGSEPQAAAASPTGAVAAAEAGPGGSGGGGGGEPQAAGHDSGAVQHEQARFVDRSQSTDDLECEFSCIVNGCGYKPTADMAMGYLANSVEFLTYARRCQSELGITLAKSSKAHYSYHEETRRGDVSWNDGLFLTPEGAGAAGSYVARVVDRARNALGQKRDRTIRSYHYLAFRF
ncbi:hypothetical protein HYH02_001008 [Chlamydomonas schloesseri]|uniref:Uncharacterized protein n=1 Tax=Chlamydomonas schloesseri TaxID=2026947 RepID=A0A835WWL2_9CHLO|nr:hypothetical protein HYH02_001008 [Chlamydomonas schloesseri]|eukprot:KAG2453961.1 hypothetical protein HYH02_001008 [Chlamydomonas schloesseri]